MSKRFVPVEDTETPRSERKANDPSFAKHRQFDTPFSKATKSDPSKQGWGVSGFFGSNAPDHGAQRSSKWEMVKDENGKWIPAAKLARMQKKAEEEAVASGVNICEQRGNSAPSRTEVSSSSRSHDSSRDSRGGRSSSSKSHDHRHTHAHSRGRSRSRSRSPVRRDRRRSASPADSRSRTNDKTQAPSHRSSSEAGKHAHSDHRVSRSRSRSPARERSQQQSHRRHSRSRSRSPSRRSRPRSRSASPRNDRR